MSLGAEAELVAGVAAQVLVGEEEQLVAPGEGPGDDGPGVGRRAHGAAVVAHERLQGGRGVHVGDRDDAIDVGDAGDGVPRLLDGFEVGHVGHGAAGVEVGEDHLLVVGGQDVGRLGHEMDAAEHDVVGVAVVGGQAGQPEGVASGVGPAHDLVALVVVAEDQEAGAEGGLGRADPCRQVVWRGVGVARRGAALEPEHGGTSL